MTIVCENKIYISNTTLNTKASVEMHRGGGATFKKS